MNSFYTVVNKRFKARSKRQGFTLLELMIVVMVVAVLAAFAYPAYTQFLLKGWRAEGRMALHELLLQQESYMNQTGTYKIFSAGATGTPFRTFSGDNASGSAYLLGARECSGKTLRECVELFAVPVASKNDPVIDELVIDSTGAKSCTSTDVAVCWP